MDKRKVFFTSDHHFGHENILKYESEKRVDQYGYTFKTIDQMNDHLVDKWNEVVGPDDLVYYLGDFSFKPAIAREVMPFLNGEKILVVGNHDPHFKKLVKGKTAVIEGFSEVHLQLTIEIEGIGKVLLCHFPYLPTDTKSMDPHELRYIECRQKRGQEALLLHGHVHSMWQVKKEDKTPLMINVGIDVWNLQPVSEHELIKLYKEFK